MYNGNIVHNQIKSLAKRIIDSFKLVHFVITLTYFD